MYTSSRLAETPSIARSTTTPIMALISTIPSTRRERLSNHVQQKEEKEEKEAKDKSLMM
jgi:hypothetical protein